MWIYIVFLLIALAVYFLFPGVWAILDFIPRTLETIGYLIVAFAVLGMVVMLFFDKITNRKG